MKYVIDKLSDLEIIKVTVLGTLNQHIRKEILLEALSELNTNGYHKLLLDAIGSKASQDHKARTINTFDMMDSINKIETKNNIQIAILSTESEDAHKNFVKLAQIIGRVNIQYFNKYDESITWLLEGKDIFHS
jgi:hypothetical protein